MRTVDNPILFRTTIEHELNKIVNNEDISNSIEIGIYNFTIAESTARKIIKKWNNPFFVEIYISKFKTLLINLQSEYVQQLACKNPYNVAFMTHQEFNPEKWKPLLEKKQKIEQFMLSNKLTANTDMFTCFKCKSKNCSYYQLQIRSADEPMTTFVTCIDCENHWKC
jgi:DNA-directed RNA polymerase subunit M/transcription elongation factor TFIIS